ncbi:molybdopterin dinucleotide binding domain-containing protein [Escherichia coli]
MTSGITKSDVEFDHPQMFVRHQAFREDPDLETLGTPSGLIEIYSKTIADMNYDDCQGHPMWFEKIERSHGGPGSQKYPLHLQSVHPDFRLHSQLCESETLRQQYTVAGKEPVFISPKDASARGIRHGDVVRVFNVRGQVLAGQWFLTVMHPAWREFTKGHGTIRTKAASQGRCANAVTPTC